MHHKRLAGLWLDQTKAVIAKNHDGSEAAEFKLANPVKAVIQHGNSNENTGNNAEITNKHKFFKNILDELTNTEELYITGGGTIQEELKSYIEETAQFRDMKVTLGTSQQLSDEQLLETVKSQFGK